MPLGASSQATARSSEATGSGARVRTNSIISKIITISIVVHLRPTYIKLTGAEF